MSELKSIRNKNERSKENPMALKRELIWKCYKYHKPK